jgi:hypothetical protein
MASASFALRASFGKEPPYEAQVMVAGPSADRITTVAMIKARVQAHFHLGTCRVLGFPKPPKAAASAAAAASKQVDTDTWLLCDLWAGKPGVTKVALVVVGQKQSNDQIAANEEAMLQDKLDRDARIKFYETRLREQQRLVEAERDANIHQRNRISIRSVQGGGGLGGTLAGLAAGGGNNNSIVQHQIATLNDYCLTNNYVEVRGGTLASRSFPPSTPQPSSVLGLLQMRL